MTPVFHRYFVREKPRQAGDWTSWAEVVIGSNGFFSTISDYGNWSHHWGSGLPAGMDMRSWVARELYEPEYGCDYFRRKVSKKEEVDEKATIEAVKDFIIRHRRDGSWTREKAREEWDYIDLYLDPHDWDEGRWFSVTEIEEPYELIMHRWPADIRLFCENIMPVLAEAIEAELAAEAETAIEAHPLVMAWREAA